PDVEGVERRAVGATVVLRADDRCGDIVLRLLAVNVRREQSIADEVDRNNIRVEEELHDAGVRVAIDHLILFESVDADSISVHGSEVTGGENVGVAPDAIFRVVWEEEAPVRVRLRDERVPKVRAGRVTADGDRDTVVVGSRERRNETPGCELTEEPAISRLVIEHDW